MPKKASNTRKTNQKTTIESHPPQSLHQPTRNALPPEQPTESVSWYANQWIVITLLTVAVLAAFAGSFGNEFLDWDDTLYVTQNKYIQAPTFASLLHLLRVECALNFHPLTMASLWLNAFLFGTGPTAFIVTNTLVHLLNTLLVFRLTQQLTSQNSPVAFLTALLWGVHPLHVESVTWISERKDVLYTCFFLLSCSQYIKFIHSNNRKFLIYSFVLFVCSCLSKGMAVVLPLVLLLLDYWFGRDWFSGKNILQKVPFFVVSLAFGLLAIHLQNTGDLGGFIEKMTSPDLNALDSNFTLWQRIRFGFYGFCVYLFKLIVPIELHNFYAYPLTSHYTDLPYLLAPVVAVVILGIAIGLYRRSKIVFFGVLFFFITIITVLQFLSVGSALLAERYVYIPSIGLLLMLVYGLLSRFSSKLVVPVLMLVALLFIGLTARYVRCYQNTVTLFEQSAQAEKKHNIPELHVRLGLASYSQGDLTKALTYYDEGLRMEPTVIQKLKLANNLGVTYKALGDYARAATAFEQALQLDSVNQKTYLKQIAFANIKLQNYPKAKSLYSRLIELGGIGADTAYNNRAVVRLYLNDRLGAIQDFKQALQLNPTYAEAATNLKRFGTTP